MLKILAMGIVGFEMHSCPVMKKKITSIAAFWHLHWSLRSNFSTRCCFTACACYFLTNFYLSPNDSPLKTVTDVFYFIEKALFVLEIFDFLCFHLVLFFSVSHCSRAWSKINLKVYDVANCLKKNLIIHLVWYLQKEKKVWH